MHEFDTYIYSIIGSLRIGKNRKDEIAEEFKDHLELLKLEYIEKGLAESEAIKRAIKSFGESNEIKKKLLSAISGFRNLGNILLGVVITLIVFIYSYIPMSGVIIAFNNYKTATAANYVSLIFNGDKWNIVSAVMLFIPIGYFIPIIFNRICKVMQLALILSIFGILIGAFLSKTLIGTINMVFLLTYLAGGLFGGMIGYVILFAVNRLNVFKKSIGVKKAI